MAAAKTLTIQEISEMIDVSPRSIRKALRNTIDKDAQPGRGGRWTFNEKDIPTIKSIIEKSASNSAPVDLSAYSEV